MGPEESVVILLKGAAADGHAVAVAGGGVGQSIALHLAEDGFDVAVHYIGEEEGALVTVSGVGDRASSSRVVFGPRSGATVAWRGVVRIGGIVHGA